MLFWATVLSTALYLLPVFAVVVARSRRAMPLWEIALTIPAVVAFDMLAGMTVGHALRFETATLLSRPAWLVGAALVAARRRRSGDPLAWPDALGARPVLGCIAAATIGFYISTQLSRPYHLWDRHWHIPLVTMMRAERLPFSNVFEPGHALHYHVTGDVLGAILQTYSLGVLNSSLALSVAHDVMFGLIAATTALLMFAFGVKRAWPAVLGAVALLLQGPSSLRGKIGNDYYGYSFDSLLIAGFRPHVPLACLLIVGIVGVAAVGLTRSAQVRLRVTVPVLIACAALLAVTDEASLGILGLSLGLTWLVSPNVVAHGRFAGVLVFFALAAAGVGATLFFSGSLSPGGPVQAISWVPAHSPGTQHLAPLLLSTKDGKEALFYDLLPLLACAVGLGAAAMRRPATVGVLVLGGSALAIALVLFTKLEVNHTPSEAQRFMIAPCCAVVLLALLSLGRAPSGSFATVMVIVGLGLASFSTIAWVRQRVTDLGPEAVEAQHPNFHEMDCRKSTGAHLGEDTTLVYFDPAIYGAWLGCHPSFAAGKLEAQWGIKIFPLLDAVSQLAALDSGMVAADESLVAVCAWPNGTDPVCKYAEDHRRCVPSGADVRRCTLTPHDRRAILGTP